MMKNLTKREVLTELNEILPIPFKVSKRSFFSVFKLRQHYHLERLKERYSLVNFEYMPYEKETMKMLYDFIFEDAQKLSGEVVYFSFLNFDQGGVKMKASELKNFFMEEALDFGMDSFYFMFIQERKILVYDHSNITFEIMAPYNLREQMLAFMLHSLACSIKA